MYKYYVKEFTYNNASRAVRAKCVIVTNILVHCTLKSETTLLTKIISTVHEGPI